MVAHACNPSRHSEGRSRRISETEIGMIFIMGSVSTRVHNEILSKEKKREEEKIRYLSFFFDILLSLIASNIAHSHL